MRTSALRGKAAVMMLVGLTAILLIICSAVWLTQWSLLKADLQALHSRNLPTSAAGRAQYDRLPDRQPLDVSYRLINSLQGNNRF